MIFLAITQHNVAVGFTWSNFTTVKKLVIRTNAVTGSIGI